MASSAKMEGPSAPAVRRDPYEVLSVPRDSSDQEIKSAYRKLALKSVPPFSSMLLFMLLCSVNLFARFREKQDATPLVVQNALSRFVCTLQQGRSRSLCMQILLSDAIYVKFAYASLYT